MSHTGEKKKKKKKDREMSPIVYLPSCSSRPLPPALFECLSLRFSHSVSLITPLFSLSLTASLIISRLSLSPPPPQPLPLNPLHPLPSTPSRDATDMRQDVATLLLLVEVEELNSPDDVMQTLLKAKTVQVGHRTLHAISMR